MKNFSKLILFIMLLSYGWYGCQKESANTKINPVTAVESTQKQVTPSAEQVEKAVQAYINVEDKAKANQGKSHTRKQIYAAGLSSMNESGASGVVVLDLEGDVLSVQVDLTGLYPGAQYMQHIREVIGNKARSQCPDNSNDSNGDGRIDMSEGLSTFGSIRLHMDPFPVADANGEIHYSRKFTLTDYHWLDLKHMDLSKCNIVICGLKVNNEFDPMMPASCGSLFKAR